MTSRAQIERWFDEGVARGATHMVVASDFNHEDYPVYVDPNESAREVAQKYDGHNLQRLMEVYSLKLDKAAQLAEFRAFHYE